MAITTLDQAGAGMQYPREIIKAATPTLVTGRPHSLFYLAGYPGAAVAPTPGLAGAALTSYLGQLPFTNPVAGNTHLGRFQAQSTLQAGSLLLCDRLWHNSGLSLTVTTAQTINSVAWPARDATGTINGEAIHIGLEVTTATGAGTPVFSMGYTNSAGTAGRTGAGILTGVATSAVGSFYQMGVQAGDLGVRSLQTFTLSATWSASGAASLVAYRILSRLELGSGVANSIDWLTSGAPRFFNDSVPFLLFIPSTTTATNINGHVIYTQG